MNALPSPPDVTNTLPPPPDVTNTPPPPPPQNAQTSAPPIFDGETGCKIAKIDGWHDHHTISGLDPEKFVVGHLPNPACVHPDRSEDKFMWNNLLKGYSGVGSPAQGTDYCRPISNGIQDSNKYTTLVSERYEVGHILLKSREEHEGGSLIQSLLRSQGINDDIYFFKDTGLGNFADDIHRWNGPSNAHFLITSQAQFDPGPTTTCFTDGGERQGMGTDSDRNPNVFMGVYDWDNPNEMCTNYPIYPYIDNTSYDYPLEGMIYTKFKCHMLSNIEPIPTGASTIEAKKKLEKSNTTLYILDPNKTEKGVLYGTNQIKSVFKVDKNTSDKATTLSEIVKSVSIDISKSGLDKSIIDRFDMQNYEKLYTQDGIYKLLSKKYGDHAHALKAAMDIVYFKKFEYDGSAKIFKITPQMSNGVHAYVSIDRVAITSAIIYGVPIVIYVTENGFVIYISKNLINKYSTPEKQLEVLKSNATILSSNVEILSSKIAEISNDILDSLNQKVYSIIELIQNIVSGITVNNDSEYHNLLTYYTIFSSIIKLHSSIRNSDHDDATKVNREAVDPLVQAIQNISTLSKDDLEGIVPQLNIIIQDFNKIVTLKEKYDLIVFEFESILTKLDILNTIDYNKKLKKNPSLTLPQQLVQLFDQSLFILSLSTYCNDLIDKNIAIEVDKAIPFRTMTDPSSSRRLFCCKFGSPGLPTLAMPVIKHIYMKCRDSPVFKDNFIAQLNNVFTKIVVPGSNPNLDIKRIEMFEQFKTDVNGTIDDTDITRLMNGVNLTPNTSGGSRKRKTKKRYTKRSGGNKRRTKYKRQRGGDEIDVNYSKLLETLNAYINNPKGFRLNAKIKLYRHMYSAYMLLILLYKLVLLEQIQIEPIMINTLNKLLKIHDNADLQKLFNSKLGSSFIEIFEPDAYEFNSFDSYIVGEANENLLKYIHFYVAKNKKRFCEKGKEDCEDLKENISLDENIEYGTIVNSLSIPSTTPISKFHIPINFVEYIENVGGFRALYHDINESTIRDNDFYKFVQKVIEKESKQLEYSYYGNRNMHPYFSFGQMQRNVDICYDSEEVNALYDIDKKYELKQENISNQDFMINYHATIDSNIQKLHTKYNFELDISIFPNIMSYYEEAERQRQAEEAAERQRQAEEAAERQRQAEEAKRLAEEAAERQRQAEEAAERQRQAEEAKRLAEEAAERQRQEKAIQEAARPQEAPTQRDDAAERNREKTRGISSEELERLRTMQTGHVPPTINTKKRTYIETVIGGYKSSRKNKKYRKPRKYRYR
jgi:hypothetical protein